MGGVYKVTFTILWQYALAPIRQPSRFHVRQLPAPHSSTLSTTCTTPLAVIWKTTHPNWTILEYFKFSRDTKHMRGTRVSPGTVTVRQVTGLRERWRVCSLVLSVDIVLSMSVSTVCQFNSIQFNVFIYYIYLQIIDWFVSVSSPHYVSSMSVSMSTRLFEILRGKYNTDSVVHFPFPEFQWKTLGCEYLHRLFLLVGIGFLWPIGGHVGVCVRAWMWMWYLTAAPATRGGCVCRCGGRWRWWMTTGYTLIREEQLQSLHFLQYFDSLFFFCNTFLQWFQYHYNTRPAFCFSFVNTSHF